MEFDIKRISRLSKLEIDKSREQSVIDDMNQIVEFVSMLPQDADISENMGSESCVLRSDLHKEKIESIDVSSLSDYTENGCFCVPKTV